MFRKSLKHAPDISLAFLVVSLQRLLDWPIVDLIGVRNLKNYSDFVSVVSQGKLGYSDWSLVQVNSIGAGDFAWLCAKIMYSLQISISGTIFVVQVLFVFCLRKLLSRLRALQFFAFVVLCPPVVFAMQRANIDLVIFILLFLAFRYIKKVEFSTIFITIATLIKFYPLVLFAFPLVQSFKQKKKRILTCSLFSIALIDCLREVPPLNIPKGGSVQMGLPTAGYYFAVILERIGGNTFWYNYFGWFCIGLACISFILVSLHLLYRDFVINSLRSFLSNNLDLAEDAKLQFTFYAYLSLTLFLAGLSFDYRLIFVVPLLSIISIKRAKSFLYQRILGLLIIGSIYFSGAIWVPLQFIGDCTMFLLFSTFIYSWLIWQREKSVRVKNLMGKKNHFW
jgi:hypothetical protein